MASSADRRAPERLSVATSAEINRRRRGRNWLLGGALLALVALFYVITIVKIGLTT